MGKQTKWETIMDLEVQDPKNMIIFSSRDLVSSEIHWKNKSIDRIDLILSSRVPDFIKGREKTLMLHVLLYENNQENW